ncbi:MAG: hypothetical protein AAF293_16125 [Pseudomonadota bacterium]
MEMIAKYAVLATIVLLPMGAGADETRKTPPEQVSNEFIPPKPKDGFRYPDCFCTDSKGDRVDVGRMACLTIGSRSFTARCAKSLNNTIWRQVSEGCPSV